MRIYLLIILSYLIFSPAFLWAENDKEYVKTTDYISAALGAMPEKSSVIWITKDIRPDIIKILRRSNFPLRYRYYRRGNHTVWILDEIGKVMPITTGVTIEDGKIIDLTVLTYRESHGSEIRFPAYSNQYNSVTLTNGLHLSKPINGISGATLSTNAMKRVSRLALYLHNKVLEKDGPSQKK